MGNNVTQQTRNIDPIFVYCWSSIADCGSTLNQLWFNVMCLLGNENGEIIQLTVDLKRLKDMTVHRHTIIFLQKKRHV